MNKYFTKFINAYLKYLKLRNLSESTIKARKWKLNKFIGFLEKKNIKSIDAVTKEIIIKYQVEINQSLNHRNRCNSVTYQNNLLVSVKQFFKFLHERGYLISDPAKNIEYAKEPKKLPTSILTPAEARKIIHAPDKSSVIGYRDRTILEVLYSSGIRKSEVNNLMLNDVDYVDGFLRITEGKGRKDRVVPIGRIACRYLENYINAVRTELVHDDNNHYLFLSLYGNKLSKNVIWEMVKKYARKAGIKKNVYPHTFRHTCATAMLKNRADINSVRELLGHESLKTTQKYAHLTITDLKDVHRRCHPRERG